MNDGHGAQLEPYALQLIDDDDVDDDEEESEDHGWGDPLDPSLEPGDPFEPPNQPYDPERGRPPRPYEPEVDPEGDPG